MISPEGESPTEPSSLFLRSFEEKVPPKGSWHDQEILVALSGGLDSVCLLRLLVLWQQLFQYRLEAVHFNHGLRGFESDLDAEFCDHLCSELSVKLHLIKLNFDGVGSNLQARARRARNSFYKNWKMGNCDRWVATAHHLDDSLESFMIGVHQGRLDSRLLPLKFIDEKARLLRPLVACRKKNLEVLARNYHWRWREDSSNSKNSYLRNYYRNDWLEAEEYCRNIASIMRCLDNMNTVLVDWLVDQYERFKNRGGLLLNDDPKAWEESRFRDFWLTVLRFDYPEFIGGFDSKRLQQVRVQTFNGLRKFKIAQNSEISKKNLMLIASKSGYYLEVVDHN